MDMYVVYEGKDGKTRRAAGAVADAAASRGVPTLVRSIDESVPDDLLAAEVLVAGCGTRVDTPFGGQSSDRMVEWIGSLPSLDGRPVGVFCRYTIFPHTFADTTARVSEVLALLERGFDAKGATVVATRSFHSRELTKGAESLVSQLVEHVDTTTNT